MVESGPASGFWGAAELGRLIGEPNVLALDIGGTTAKCSLIEGGHVKIMTDYWIGRNRTSAGYPIMVPVVDLVEIGNGGGSIAWVDDFGKLRVGPAVGRRDARARRVRTRRHRGDDDRRQPRARPHQQGLLLRRRDRRRHGRGRPRARRDRRPARDRPAGGRARRRAHREQQHDQRAQVDLGQPRLRPARLHARRLRRRRRHARRRARHRARACRRWSSRARQTSSPPGAC